MSLHFFTVSLATFPKAAVAGGAGEDLERGGQRKSVRFCLSWVKVNFQWEMGGAAGTTGAQVSLSFPRRLGHHLEE